MRSSRSRTGPSSTRVPLRASSNGATPAPSWPPPTTARAATRSCSHAPSGRRFPTRARAHSSPCSSTAPTCARRATSTIRRPLVEGRAERRELRLQLGRHRLHRRHPHVVAEPLFEPVALRTPVAGVEMTLGLGDLGLGECAVEKRLHHLLALLAPVDQPGTAS